MVEVHTITKEEAESLAIKILNDSNLKLAQAGRNNWVFLSQDNVVSIPRNCDKISYDIRAAAINLLEENDVPTTDLVDYGFLDGIEYIVTKKVEETSLDLRNFSSQERRELHSNTAKILNKVHKITDVNKFGRLDGKLQGSHSTWQNFVEDFFLASIKRLRTSDDLWQKYGQVLEREFEKSVDLCQDVDVPIFLHGDYHLGNLIFGGINVNAVIDLDIVMSGDPLWDFAHYCRTFNVGRLDGIDAFSKTYEGLRNSDKERLYALTIWTRKIASQGENRRGALKETLPELEKILRWDF